MSTQPRENEPASTSPETGRALRNATAFALAYIVQRGIGFITLPLYTRAVTPAEYGTLGTLVAIAAAATILFSLGLDQAVFRQFFQLDTDAERRAYVTRTWRFTIWISLTGAAALTLAAWLLLPRSAPFTLTEFTLALLGAAVGVAAMTVPGSALRAAEAIRPYVLLTLVTAIIAPTCGILLVVVAGLGVTGFLIGTLIANLLTFVAALRLVPWTRQTPASPGELRESLRFSLPLVPHFLSHWALQIADRLLLAALVSTTALGYYSLAANIAVPFMVAASSLNQGFMPTYARAGKDPGSAAALRHTIVQQVALIAAISVAGVLLGPPLTRLLSPPAYHDAAGLIAWITLGYGLLGLYYIPMNVATLTVGRSRYAWVATATSAGVNLALIWWLVPNHGVQAAAQASAAGYGVLLVLITIYAHSKPNPLSYDVPRLAMIGVAAGIAWVAGATIDLEAPLAELLARGVVWATLLASLAGCGVLPLPARVRGLLSRG